jgi:hypothetical protein
MPLLTILTATYPPSNKYLKQAAESIAASGQLPDGWEMEWVIQEDLSSIGDSQEKQEPVENSLLQAISGVQVKHKKNLTSLGIPQTRNLAIARSEGELIRNLDSDDLLPSNALTDAITALLEYRSAVFVVGNALDLNNDQSLSEFDLSLFPTVDWKGDFSSLFKPGLQEPGLLVSIFKKEGVFPIHCSCATFRRQIVLAFGGYPAIPRNDDLALFASLSEIAPWDNLEQTALIYRRWEGQTTNQDHWNNQDNLSESFINQRCLIVKKMFQDLTSGNHKIENAVNC